MFVRWFNTSTTVIGLLCLFFGFTLAYNSWQKVSSERQVLIDLFLSTNGRGWRNNYNWLSNIDRCSWYGVICNKVGGNVTALDLSSNLLIGTLPSSLEQLTNLHNLSLSFNQ